MIVACYNLNMVFKKHQNYGNLAYIDRWVEKLCDDKQYQKSPIFLTFIFPHKYMSHFFCSVISLVCPLLPNEKSYFVACCTYLNRASSLKHSSQLYYPLLNYAFQGYS